MPRSLSNVELRTKMAEAASSVIPFHCIICFDEFNTTDRPPMVLPCGHTYVCLPCSKRLKRCMECRESLFLPSPETTNHSTATVPALPINSNSRPASTSRQPQTPTITSQPTARVPLPIPKNLVLLALMEAAERTFRPPTSRKEDPPAAEADHPDDLKDDDDEYRLDPDRVLDSMSLWAGPSGTYVVRDIGGLVVLPHDPRRSKSHDIDNSTTASSANDVKLWSTYDLQDQADQEQIRVEGSPGSQHRSAVELENYSTSLAVFNTEASDSSITTLRGEEVSSHHSRQASVNSGISVTGREPFLVEYGQKLQVVAFDDGVYTLARNEGFILATSNTQLLKIDAPLDDSCRWEGLLNTVVREQRKVLQGSLQEKLELEQALLQKIQLAQSHPPTFPIISEAPQNVEPPPRPVNSFDTTSISVPTPATPITSVAQPSLSLRHAPDSEPQSIVSRTSVTCGVARNNSMPCPSIPHSPNSIDNSDLTPSVLQCANLSVVGNLSSDCDRNLLLRHRLEKVNAIDRVTALVRSSSHANLGLGLKSSSRLLTSQSPTNPYSSNNPQYSMTSTTAAVSSSQGSVGGHINFRSGLSGHYGLASSAKRSFPNNQASGVRMRGEHRGLGANTTRGRRPKFA